MRLFAAARKPPDADTDQCSCSSSWFASRGGARDRARTAPEAKNSSGEQGSVRPAADYLRHRRASQAAVMAEEFGTGSRRRQLAVAGVLFASSPHTTAAGDARRLGAMCLVEVQVYASAPVFPASADAVRRRGTVRPGTTSSPPTAEERGRPASAASRRPAAAVSRRSKPGFQRISQVDAHPAPTSSQSTGSRRSRRP